MTEEVGEAAEERRQRVREEIMRRRVVLEERRKRRNSSSTGTFDTLVDKDGNLRKDDDPDLPDEPLARSTAIDTNVSEVSTRHREQPDTRGISEEQSQYQRELLEAIDRDRLRIALPSEVSSNHPSESLIDLTPTSEFPEAEVGWSDHRVGQQPLTESEFSSISSRRSSNNSIDARSGLYYAPPEVLHDADDAGIQSPFSDNQAHQVDVSTASSIAGSLTHVHHDFDDTLSDGTLSDNDHLVEGIATPASWSEVGSVISADDDHHH